MSFKAKDLHFDNEQPAFLRRLRGELTSGDTARHEQPIPRNKRMKKDDDDDDAPTYVLEETKESLTKEEYDALVSGKHPKEKEEGVVDDASEKKEDSNKTHKDTIAQVGAGSKKRKAGKLIADEKEHTKEDGGQDIKKDVKPTKKSKKKSKVVKLTFGEDEA